MKPILIPLVLASVNICGDEISGNTSIDVADLGHGILFMSELNHHYALSFVFFQLYVSAYFGSLIIMVMIVVFLT